MTLTIAHTLLASRITGHLNQMLAGLTDYHDIITAWREYCSTYHVSIMNGTRHKLSKKCCCQIWGLAQKWLAAIRLQSHHTLLETYIKILNSPSSTCDLHVSQFEGLTQVVNLVVAQEFGCWGRTSFFFLQMQMLWICLESWGSLKQRTFEIDKQVV